MPPVIETDLLLVIGPHDHGPPPMQGLRACVWTEQDASPRHVVAREAAYDDYNLVFDIHRGRCASTPGKFLPGWAEWDACAADLDLKDRPIDCLFYGALSERRREILSSLGKEVAIEQPAFFLAGESKRGALRLAKTVLIVHAYDRSTSEPFRLAEAASCGALIVTEPQGDPEPFVETDFITAPSHDLAKAIQTAIQKYPLFVETRRRAFDRAKANDAHAAVATILAALPCPTPA